LRGFPHASRGFAAHGVLRRMTGMTFEAEGCEAPVGSRCVVVDHDGSTAETEVVGFSGGSLLLVATDDVGSVTPGARVIPSGRVFEARAGDALLGRVLDGAGQPLDGLRAPRCDDRVNLTPRARNPLDRKPIREPLDVGVRSINALLTVGRGQRLGRFAGRLVRVHSALFATSIAEHVRDRGKNVLLLMDSLTRVSQAQREIALAIGEPPVTKGYPVSVFAKLPQLVERAGNGGPNGGSITAIYTVLTEGDDLADPIADAARAVLDGHIVLSRQIAETGLYPAIDVEASISRLMPLITSPEQQRLIRRFRQLNAAYAQNRDLITIGAYAKGSDPRVDEAIQYWPVMQKFLQQDGNEAISLAKSVEALQAMFPTERTREVTR
jgi:flagellum-specific ATP synthase